MINRIPLDEKKYPSVKYVKRWLRQLCKEVREHDKHTICIEGLSNVNGSDGVVKVIGRTELPDSAVKPYKGKEEQ